MSGPVVAILGATSQLALDFIDSATSARRFRLRLYARRPEIAAAELARRGIRSDVEPLAAFSARDHDAIVNFIGVGDPAKAGALGAGIFAATQQWDEAVLAYMSTRPRTRYVFLSSGAAYGDAFGGPVTADSAAVFPLNQLKPENWYGLAKLSAEARHRACPQFSILDVRIFNYFSKNVDIEARFLITDMIRAARAGVTFETADSNMVRDYLEPVGLYRLLAACIDADGGLNTAVDAYTKAPLSKRDLLALMSDELGLRYRFATGVQTVNATGAKPFYHSLNRRAEAIGYVPPFTSAEGIVAQLRQMPGDRRARPNLPFRAAPA